MTEANAAPTDAQLIEWNHKTCPYFTIDRSRAVEWPHDLETNKEAFAEMLGKSDTVFLRNCHWAVIIGSNYFANLVEPITDYGLALDGHLGVMSGCKLVTDAFCEPVAKDPAPPAIYFIPREV